MAKAAVTGTLFLTGLVGVAAIGALGVKPPNAEAGGAFEPGANVGGLNDAEMKQAARALSVADRLKASPHAVLSMVVAAMGESHFNPVPNRGGSGYCGVFQADPANIPCSATEQQARHFLTGGLGFNQGGAIYQARHFPGRSPGDIATRVESGGMSPNFYDRWRPQAERIIAAWRAGGLALTVPFGPMQGSPKEIIDRVVLPISNAAGVPRTVAQNDAANARHGPTASGGHSDHQGPPDQRWAADMSNGTHPTPEMDRLADELAERFGIPWDGSGLVTYTHGGYRFQLIYRSSGHLDHVHVGILALAGPPNP